MQITEPIGAELFTPMMNWLEGNVVQCDQKNFQIKY